MAALVGRVREWLSGSALPLWSSVGVDAEQGGFTERLSLEGQPDFDAAKRVRVQARQIYVFSHAATLGLSPNGVDIARTGYDFLMAHALPDGIEAGFVHSLDRRGAVRDAKRDTYDHAFLLFAFSWFYRATARQDVLDVIRGIGDFIWASLRHPGGEGFVVDVNETDALHQNPHMHLFESVLAAYNATGDAVFLDRASELFRLFQERMFDQELGVLREFYDRDWQPAPGDTGQIVEPGHHCEWIWLLKWYADRAGTPLCEEAFRLGTFVEQHGRTADGLLLVDEVWTDGRVKKANTRSWPLTESIKAEIALAEARGVTVGDRVDAMVIALFDTFLDKPIRGAWIDWFDPDGAPLVSAIPASTFYHVFLALSEYLRARASQA
jgi:mannose/cellobiose epimerase-like protein (N-acyl-D-glucosamine 2-epimerase family)